MNRALFTLLAITALACVTTRAHAYVRESTNWNPSTLPVTYMINQATIPSTLGTAAGIGAVEGGFATWAAPACTSWRTTDSGNTTLSANTNDRRNVISWVTAWPAELGDVNSVIGVTTPVWSVGGFFIDADIQFNAQHFRWNTTGTGGAAFVDAQSIATHEEGHFLGLDHTPTSSAIMYASYSGNLKRNLGPDDQNGVCAIYPSGVAATDSGVHIDAGSVSSDPCSAWGNTCDGCTPHDGCGFCTATSQCVSGTQNGPIGSACASGYVWFQQYCSATTPTDAGPATGGGRFGDPCTQPTDCASGGLCVTDTSGAGFCSQACADDCGCPGGYTCYAVSATISVCVPGTSTCSTGTDAGTIQPGTDAAVLPGTDGAVLPVSDAAMAMGDDGGTTTPRRTHTCGCSAVGMRDATPAWLALGAIGLMLARRRARR